MAKVETIETNMFSMYKYEMFGLNSPSNFLVYAANILETSKHFSKGYVVRYTEDEKEHSATLIDLEELKNFFNSNETPEDTAVYCKLERDTSLNDSSDEDVALIFDFKTGIASFLYIGENFPTKSEMMVYENEFML